MQTAKLQSSVVKNVCYPHPPDVFPETNRWLRKEIYETLNPATVTEGSSLTPKYVFKLTKDQFETMIALQCVSNKTRLGCTIF